jgi:hemolysin activation/secretion protein
MCKKIWLLLTATGAFLCADETVLVPEVRALILTSQQEVCAHVDKQQVSGLHIIDLSLPGSEKVLKRRLEPLFLGKDLSKEDIESILNAIAAYYRECYRPIVEVTIPDQDVTDGVLCLLVTEGKLGKITVTGNQWTHTAQLEEQVSVRPWEPIDENLLIQDLTFMNRNPFRRVDVIYAPGTEDGLTDIELRTQERRELRLYAGAENTGLKHTGRQRLLAGFNWGNVFGLDHILSYQYTSSVDFYKFQAHTAQYTAPLRWRHVLEIFGGYSTVHTHLSASPTRNHGTSALVSVRYAIPLRPTHSYLHEVSLGFDFKRTNNTVEYLEDGARIGKNVNITQIVGAYNASYEGEHTTVSYELELVWSPGQWVSDQTKADYQSLRPLSSPQYIYGKAFFVEMFRLPADFTLSALLRGQMASRNLLPSEEFGLGGYSTVRGYEERAVNGDAGLLLSGELRTPERSLLRLFGASKVRDTLQFLGFIDYGLGVVHNPISREEKSQYLLSIGPGLRYAIDSYLSARLDWGIKLRRKGFEGSYSEVHFGIVASY